MFAEDDDEFQHWLDVASAIEEDVDHAMDSLHFVERVVTLARQENLSRGIVLARVVRRSCCPKQHAVLFAMMWPLEA
ncbi:hypothetical protein [Streptomyces sp. URMC 129]|uniref:hypothetical protein n=1 Tax=Streptomyces sp. URMC 129 TaxID=3423407 RepID=UPI003F195B60